jgi:pimeloyl-ACP methyl ester carboxylesterase
MYFHGWPGARVEGRLGDEAAMVSGVRLIALDRPGMGLSDFQSSRKLVDWPDDVAKVAATLGLNRFAVLGISGGGPYAAACAWKLADRLTGAGIVSSLAPFDVPGAIASMGRRNRLTFQLVGHLGVMRRILMARVERAVSRRPERILKSGVAAAMDKEYLDRPEVRKILGESLSEAFRNGSRGPAWEMGLYTRPWAFRLQDIGAPVHLWHGEQDGNAPISMGRFLATTIPECRATFYPGEGHLHFVDRLPEILAAVRPRSS